MDHGSSDVLLIERIKDGDKNALYALYDKYAAALFGVIVRMCKEKEVAEDLLQESFIKIWEKIHSYDPAKGRFYTWSYRIAKNTTLNHLRKAPSLIQKEDLSVYENEEDQTADTNYEQLNGLLNDLDPHHREAIELVYFRGYTHAEGHKVMDVPLGTFKSYVRQALMRLREMRSELYLVWVSIEILLNG